MAGINALLRPKFLTKVVSQQAGTADWLLNLFGCQPGGSSEVNLGHGREGAFYIYDNVRKVGKLTNPGTAANRRKANPTGKTTFTYPRMHDSVNLLAETLHNISKIDNTAERDAAGEQYIGRQTNTLSQLSANFRKVMLAGMLRDSLYANSGSGETSFLDFTQSGNSQRISFNMPAGNKSQLDMLGDGDIIDGSWATATSDIVTQLLKVNAAFQQLCGGGLRHVILPAQQWANILANDTIEAAHGTANSPFQSLRMDQLAPMVGEVELNLQAAVLNFMPWVTFWITDEGFDLGEEGSESFEKLVPDNNAIFIGNNPSSDTVSCYLGSEPVAEYDGGPETVRAGLSAWSVKRSNPTTTDLFALDNSLVVNHVPKSIAYGTVEF